MPPTHHQRWLDRFGAAGSLACALHCALLPLLIAALPSLGLAIWLSDGVELGFVVFATLLGGFSLLWGYRRHRALRTLGLLLPDLAVPWAAVLYAPLHETVLPHAVAMTLGGPLVALGDPVYPLPHLGHVHDASCTHCRLARRGGRRPHGRIRHLAPPRGGPTGRTSFRRFFKDPGARRWARATARRPRASATSPVTAMRVRRQ